jgi:hypothetical protein
MSITHYLITDATAEEVERRTGMRGHDTPLGVLVEKPPRPSDITDAMERINRALYPTRCTCGMFAIMHWPNCPMALAIS